MRASPVTRSIAAARDLSPARRFGTLTDAVNIPLPQLRERLDELPQDRAVVIFCQKGQRGYLATRILAAHGFEDVRNLAGGFLQAMHNGWPITRTADESPGHPAGSGEE